MTWPEIGIKDRGIQYSICGMRLHVLISALDTCLWHTSHYEVSNKSFLQFVTFWLYSIQLVFYNWIYDELTEALTKKKTVNFKSQVSF